MFTQNEVLIRYYREPEQPTSENKISTTENMEKWNLEIGCSSFTLHVRRHRE